MGMRRRWVARSIRSVGKYRRRRRRRWTVLVNEAVCSVVRKCALLRAAVPETARGIDSPGPRQTLLDDVRGSCRRPFRRRRFHPLHATSTPFFRTILPIFRKTFFPSLDQPSWIYVRWNSTSLVRGIHAWQTYTVATTNAKKISHEHARKFLSYGINVETWNSRSRF